MAPQSIKDPSAQVSASVRSGAGQDVVHTVCGREFMIGDLCLPGPPHPAARVSLSTRLLSQDDETLWASFTPDEARRLAARLLAHAAAADSAGSDDMAAQQPRVEADYVDTRHYLLRIGGQQPPLDLLDGPEAQDAAAKLLTASLIVDLIRRTERFLARHETRRDGLRVSALRRSRATGSAAEADAVEVVVTTPPSLSRERKDALRALLSRSVLRDPRRLPPVKITVD